MDKTSFSLEIDKKTITFEIGTLALQATSSVLARTGDTTVLVTVVEGQERDLGYFPLSVEYVERLYAGGRIKGSRWVKREGRPTDDAILTARLIDRSIRPLFPKEYKKEVQIVVTVLSVDGENEPDILSLNAVSAALHISRIPWKGPIGAVRAAYIANNLVFNPTTQEIVVSDLDLVVSQTKEKTHMLEAGGRQVSEEVAYEAVEKAHEVTGKIIDFIEDMAKKAGEKKTEVAQDAKLYNLIGKIEKSYKAEIVALVEPRAKKEATGSDWQDLINRIYEELKMAEPTEDVDKKVLATAAEMVFFKAIKEGILEKSKRPDGRKMDEIRPISVEVGMLPRTHGSAIFQRGNTQALTVVTLGSPRMEQLIESAEGEESKRYIHHYSMPPYSIGEAGRMGTPSRREIGHGALAERAIMGVIPMQEKFPYTIRVVSEILSSNGSTSMASTCGSTLALMDAGVPIEAPVAGIAMGLMTRSATSAQGSKDQKDYVILTDIIGLEDFSGDMDFKVAGTIKGITAIQLDVKIMGLTDAQVKETYERAKVARLFILDKMNAVISEPRKKISQYAPKIEVVKIPVEKIGEVIGPGGRVIKNITATTGAQIDVEDDGSVTISGISEESVQKAVDTVKGLTRELVVGEEFDGEVKRILPFGAFVEVLPGKEGMVHVSKMSTEFVKDPNDIVKLGQIAHVRVIEIDDIGRTNLSMLTKEQEGQSDSRGPKEDRRGSRRPGHRMGGTPYRFGPPSEYRTSAPVSGATTPSDHPLSRQFRRERTDIRRQGSGPSRGGPRESRLPSRTTSYRKTHY